MEGLLRNVHLNDKAGLSDKAVQFPREEQVSFEQHGKARNIRCSQSDTWSHLCFKKQATTLCVGRERQVQRPPLERGKPSGWNSVGRLRENSFPQIRSYSPMFPNSTVLVSPEVINSSLGHLKQPPGCLDVWPCSSAQKRQEQERWGGWGRKVWL